MQTVQSRSLRPSLASRRSAVKSSALWKSKGSSSVSVAEKPAK